MRVTTPPRLLGIASSYTLLVACADASRLPATPTREESPRISSTTPEAGSLPTFDRRAAARALSEVDVSSCAAPGGPTGPGHVSMVMATDGGVSFVRADKAPYADTIVGACIEEK